MFLLRAAFWFTVVAVLIPREPGHGFARGSSDPAVQVLDSVREETLARLVRVKEELKLQDREAGKSGLASS
jgi:hypothetical protein